MSLFGIMNDYNRRRQLQELSIGGNSIDANDDEFEVEPDDTEEDEAETPNAGEGDEPTTEEPSEEETAGTDTPENDNDAQSEPETQEATPESESEEPAAQVDDGAEVNSDGEGIQDDFSLPEDDGGDDETGGSNPEGEDGGDGDIGEDGEGIQDDFSMEDGEGEEGGEEGVDGDTGEAGADTGADVSGNMGVGTGETNDPTSESIKTSEEEIYDTLTDEQKKNRVLQLKIDFQSLFQQADATISAVNEIPKTEDNIESIHRIINVMNDVKKYVVDYMAIVFDKTSFLDNNATYVKYVAIFDTTRKAIDEIVKNQNDG